MNESSFRVCVNGVSMGYVIAPPSAGGVASILSPNDADRLFGRGSSLATLVQRGYERIEQLRMPELLLGFVIRLASRRTVEVSCGSGGSGRVYLYRALDTLREGDLVVHARNRPGVIANRYTRRERAAECRARHAARVLGSLNAAQSDRVTRDWLHATWAEVLPLP